MTTIQYTNLTKDYDINITRLINAILERDTLETLETETPDDAPRTSTISDALLIKAPDKIPNRPRGWVGREAILSDVLQKLHGSNDFGGQVLIQAYPGTGKTAFAKKIIETWLKTGKKGKALWLTIGSADADAIFEAIARAYGQEQPFARLNEVEQRQMIRQLFYTSRLGLLVLDDAWNGQALRQVVETVPESLPVLVTSRSRYELDEIIALPDLALNESLKLLSFHAKKDFSTDTEGTGAQKLCISLGNLAFAIEIAGNILKRTKQAPAELLQEYEHRLHELQLNSSQPGRENVAALMDTSLTSLDDEAKAVFLAFGAFFAPQVTAELMGLYFQSKVSPGSGRGDPPDRPYDMPTVTTILMRLHDNGLVDYLPKTDTTAPAFRLHDLSYAYAAAQITDAARRRALTACLTYSERYNTPGWDSFRPLLPALDTLLGAAAWAFTHGQDSNGDRIAEELVFQSQILFSQGLYRQALRLLEQGAQAAEQRGDQQAQGVYLGNLGNAYFSLGDYPRAIDHHQQALTISRAIGDKRAEGQDLGNLGNAYFSLGDYPRAIDYHQQALTIMQTIGDKSAEGSILGNLGIAYDSLGDYPRAIDHYQQALAIARDIGDKSNEGSQLGNLGNAYYSLRDTPRAIDYLEQVLKIAQDMGNKATQGKALGNLGIAYDSLGEYTRAIDFHQQALAIARDIGDKSNEGSQLGNLGI
ncbi:MAG TPA: tetratricopeptide repeat protein, partial [Phototrophicaceae bacterium]|nr:tetratricopeptide repeat protein [Phototrophicaceae bacterium]